jgi:glycosyltransferase involved in cell wall biosynthesis
MNRTKQTEKEITHMGKPSVLIPAYKPNDRMIDLIKDLIDQGFSRIIVVDDGSGPSFDSYFQHAQDMGCRVLRHAINMGKGRALKTGFNEALLCGYAEQGVITADADGQHLPSDIARVARAMEANPDAMVLGVRRFKGTVPLRNRLGNMITRGVFALVNGNGIMDTQTGLRGISYQHVPLMLTLKGERYEYEMNMLLEARPHDIKMIQVPIDTVYIEGNKHSHYRAFMDSIQIYALIIKYILSSLLAGIMDYGVFVAMHLSFPNHLMLNVVVARVSSSLVNFMINRNLVFRQKGAVAHAVCRYYALAVMIMMISYGLIWTFSEVLGLNVFLAKIISDIVLSMVSFVIQREFVYKPTAKISIYQNHESDARQPDTR